MKRISMKYVLPIIAILSVIWAEAQQKLPASKYGSRLYDYLNTNKNMQHLSKTDMADIYLDNESYSKKTGVTHSYLHQSYKGIKIFNAISNAAIKDDKVLFFKDNFEANIQQRINAITPSISALQAIKNVANHFELELKGSLDLLSSIHHKNIYSKGSLSQEDIVVELVYCKVENGTLKLSWDLDIYTLDGSHWYSVRVDALDGKILEVHDWVIQCSFDHTINHNHSHIHKLKENASIDLFKPNFLAADNSQYNVLPLPIESPNHGNFQIVSEPADVLASPFGWHDTNGVVGAEHTITRGNNVWAQDDIDGNNTTDGSAPDGNLNLNFNLPLNTLNQPAQNYLDVATVNLFYHNNVAHDILYRHGFDESNGNFQFNNYGNGGREGDNVIAQSQDGSGVNNANFATPPDGRSPRMQMFLWTPNNNNGNIAPDNLSVSGGTVAGNYGSVKPSTGNGADGIGNITGPSTTPVVGTLAVVNDGGVIPEEGCSALINSADIAGKIAIIRRGTCAFTQKIQNAQDAGAIGVIIANHNNPTNDPNYVPYVNMYGVTDPAFTIPSIFINYEDGETIINAIENGESLTATIVDNGPFLIDSSFDNGIIIHEYAHGISTRLTGGVSNSGCLQNNFQMGEGWSDWFALMFTMKATDIGTDGRGIGTFASGEATNGLGIRTRQYSTDFSINEYTFEATNDDRVVGTDPDTGDDIRLNEIVHYNGTIWATMLWDLTWAYIDKFGFDPDFYNGTGGNNRVLELVIEGLKLQGCNPDFIDGRDGLLAADTALTGGENQCLIWEVFAKRGLGVAASRGELDVFNDQVEDFNTPDPSDASLANCSTLSTEDIEENIFKIFPNPARNTVTVTTQGNLDNVRFNLFDINGRQVLSQTSNTPRRTTIDISALQSGIYVMQIESNTVTMTRKLIKN